MTVVANLETLFAGSSGKPGELMQSSASQPNAIPTGILLASPACWGEALQEELGAILQPEQVEAGVDARGFMPFPSSARGTSPEDRSSGDARISEPKTEEVLSGVAGASRATASRDLAVATTPRRALSLSHRSEGQSRELQAGSDRRVAKELDATNGVASGLSRGALYPAVAHDAPHLLASSLRSHCHSVKEQAQAPSLLSADQGTWPTSTATAHAGSVAEADLPAMVDSATRVERSSTAHGTEPPVAGAAIGAATWNRAESYPASLDPASLDPVSLGPVSTNAVASNRDSSDRVASDLSLSFVAKPAGTAATVPSAVLTAFGSLPATRTDTVPSSAILAMGREVRQLRRQEEPSPTAWVKPRQGSPQVGLQTGPQPILSEDLRIILASNSPAIPVQFLSGSSVASADSSWRTNLNANAQGAQTFQMPIERGESHIAEGSRPGASPLLDRNTSSGEKFSAATAVSGGLTPGVEAPRGAVKREAAPEITARFEAEIKSGTESARGLLVRSTVSSPEGGETAADSVAIPVPESATATTPEGPNRVAQPRASGAPRDTASVAPSRQVSGDNQPKLQPDSGTGPSDLERYSSPNGVRQQASAVPVLSIESAAHTGGAKEPEANVTKPKTGVAAPSVPAPGPSIPEIRGHSGDLHTGSTTGAEIVPGSGGPAPALAQAPHGSGLVGNSQSANLFEAMDAAAATASPARLLDFSDAQSASPGLEIDLGGASQAKVQTFSSAQGAGRSGGMGTTQLAVGYQDPVLGYVELRTHATAGGVHASLLPQSPSSEAMLTGHLGSLAGWMEDRRTPLESLSVLTFDAARSGHGHGNAQEATSGGGGDSRGGNPNPEGRSPNRDSSSEAFSEDWMNGRMDGRIDPTLTSGVGDEISRSRATGIPAGSRISVLA